MAKIPNKIRSIVHERDAAVDQDGYKDHDYIHCCSCGQWHRKEDPSKSQHHIDSNRLNNEEWNIITWCDGPKGCHGIWHASSIKNDRKQVIALSSYHYMVKLYPDREEHYRKHFKIDLIPDNQTEQFTLENTRGGNQDVYSF